jgi:hypothetical protein
MNKILIGLVCLLFTSCGFYHTPKVYRKNTIPYDIDIPLRKNVSKNKYNRNNPYYEKDTTKNKLED